jgi:hypothetical protein
VSRAARLHAVGKVVAPFSPSVVLVRELDRT